MTREGPLVEVLNGQVGERPPPLFDPQTGEYFDLVPNDGDPAEPELPGPELRGRGQRVAIVDTGLMARHPLIAPRIVAGVDCTGVGLNDENGHGTAVALVLLHVVPEVSLVNVKCITATGEGTVDAIVRGLDWIGANEPSATIVNISAGIDGRRWLFWRCEGDCDLCRATKRLADKGHEVVVAAGNRPYETLCPARLGERWLTSIGGRNVDRQFGAGTVNVLIPRYRAVPIATSSTVPKS